MGIVITKDKIYISLDGETFIDFDISAIEGEIKIDSPVTMKELEQTIMYVLTNISKCDIIPYARKDG